MPELPEVETIVRGLRRHIEGRRASSASASRLLRATPSRAAVVRGVTGRRVVSLRRRGKYMLAALDDGRELLVHLGMSGRLLLEERGSRPARHLHLSVRFRGMPAELRFYDARRFGRVALGRPEELASWTGLGRLGPEPLGAKRGEIAGALLGRHGGIKAVLLGQEAVAGLGNIYADEVLYRSRVHPLRRASSLSRREADRIELAIGRVLREAIAQGGSTIGNYVRHDGRPGGFQKEHLVYGRQGEACPRCGRTIRRAVVTGRGTHFCPGCQPTPGRRWQAPGKRRNPVPV